MNSKEYFLSFPDAHKGELNNLATSLQECIQSNSKDSQNEITSEIRKTDDSTMDFGGTLVLTLGTPALIILARAIRDWVTKEGQTSIQVNGVSVDNLRSKDVPETLKSLANVIK